LYVTPLFRYWVEVKRLSIKLAEEEEGGDDDYNRQFLQKFKANSPTLQCCLQVCLHVEGNYFNDVAN
jgi:hypothetical protein